MLHTIIFFHFSSRSFLKLAFFSLQTVLKSVTVWNNHNDALLLIGGIYEVIAIKNFRLVNMDHLIWYAPTIILNILFITVTKFSKFNVHVVDSKWPNICINIINTSCAVFTIPKVKNIPGRTPLELFIFMFKKRFVALNASGGVNVGVRRFLLKLNKF